MNLPTLDLFSMLFLTSMGIFGMALTQDSWVVILVAVVPAIISWVFSRGEAKAENAVLRSEVEALKLANATLTSQVTAHDKEMAIMQSEFKHISGSLVKIETMLSEHMKSCAA